MSGSERGWLSVLIGMLPPRFRARFAAEITSTFEARHAEARRRGRGATATLWARTTVDLLGTAALEWLRAARPTDFLADLRIASRSLARAPGFTLIAVATIALGIGANTAVFSVVRAVLLSPLAVDRPDEVVRVWSRNDASGITANFVSPENFLEIGRQTHGFADLSAWVESEGTILLGPEDTPTRATLLAATWSFVDVLGVEPALGRGFEPADQDPNAPGGVLLPHRTWVQLYGSDPDVLGRSVRFLRGDAPILGVLPPGLQWVVPDADVIVLLSGLEQHPARADRWLSVIARLTPATPVDVARAELGSLATAFADREPARNAGWTYDVEPIEEVVLGEAKPALMILLAAAGMVLLIACANVANLLLGRATTRERDIALRTALGAGRSRIAQLLITESVMLAGIGAIAGLLVAGLALDALTALGAGEVPRLDEVRLDGPVLAFTALLTVATGIVFGLAPAARLMVVRPATVLREGGRGTSGGGRPERVRSAFVVGQLALSVLLVATAGLLVRNFSAILRSDPGFEASGLITAELTLNGTRYATYDDVRELYERLGQRAREIPQVRSVGLSTSVPFGVNRDYPVPMQILGRPVADPSQLPRATNRMVDEGFVETLGITLIAGRDFTPLDDQDAEGVVLVNEAAARLFWGDADPVGESFTNAAGPFGPLGETQKGDVRVVGVVRDIRYDGLTTPTEPTVYFPFRQAPFRRMNVTLRTEGNPDDVLRGLREELKALDASLPISGVATFDDLVDRSVAQERLISTLLGIFAMLALLLAAVGVYGVLSFTVAARMNEIGIRRALGAEPSGVARLILGRTLRMVGIGVGVGLAATLVAGSAIASQLQVIGPRDPIVLSGVTLALVAVSFLASVLPLVKAEKARCVRLLAMMAGSGSPATGRNEDNRK